MSSVIDYLDWRGDLTLETSPFNEVDGVILARLAYIPFDGIVKGSFTKGTLLRQAAKEFLALPDAKAKVYRDTDLELLQKAAASPRFGNLILCGYVNIWDAKAEKQFSAITIKLSKKVSYLSYRGTDNTLVGWKEDFNMSFTCPVPSQESARLYIEQASKSLRGKFIAGGHSKGGNLAVYASAFCTAKTRKRITAVYNFDGPGFDQKVLETPGYQEICSRVTTMIPQSSIVGMLLEHEEKYIIIASNEKKGMAQHNVYSWQVLSTSFLRLESITDSSRFTDFALKAWVKNMTPEQRETFIDTSYSLMVNAGASTLSDLGENLFEKARFFISSMKGVSDESRDVVFEAVKLLLASAKASMAKLKEEKAQSQGAQ